MLGMYQGHDLKALRASVGDEEGQRRHPRFWVRILTYTLDHFSGGRSGKPEKELLYDQILVTTVKAHIAPRQVC